MPLLDQVQPATPMEAMRLEIAFEHLDGPRRLDNQLASSRKRLTAAVADTNTTVTDVFGVGPIVAAMLLGYSGDIARWPTGRRGPGRPAGPCVSVSASAPAQKATLGMLPSL